MKCNKCGKKIKYPCQGGALESLTEGYCKECAEKENAKDLELLEAIKRGENIYRFINNLD